MDNEHYDVVIIGAGLSGIGAACDLSMRCPDKRYLILEGRGCIGGTWDLFRYPGIRSDSDMFTLGYSFKPWRSGQNLADGPKILSYIREAAEEHGVLDQIRYDAWVTAVAWDSAEAAWTISYKDKISGDTKVVTGNFISSCTGYFNYEHGYEPHFEGSEDFRGDIIHPQKWPEDIDFAGKNVVVIGSGATAVTLVPELSKTTAHVTMLQRSPTYMAPVPGSTKSGRAPLGFLPDMWAYRIVRMRQITFQWLFFNLSRRFPHRIKKLLLSMVKQSVGSNIDLKHFRPSYNPWDERVCAVKDGDLFRALRRGAASIVTDKIERFTGNGIRLVSGQELEADIIVTATGLDMKFFGGIEITVDGEKYDHTTKMGYKGFMLEGLPNIGFAMGYTNSSWTLKINLTNEFFCRLLKYMDEAQVQKVVPVNKDSQVVAGNYLDFKSGYIQRALDKFPKMGNKLPWRLVQSYPVDLMMLRFGKLNGKHLEFSVASGRVAGKGRVPASYESGPELLIENS